MTDAEPATPVPALAAPLGGFAALCEQLARTPKKLEKRALIAAYLRDLLIPDAARAALYLSGAPFAETDLRRLQVGGSTLSKAVAQLSGASGEAMQAAYRRYGDLGDAAFALFTAAREADTAQTASPVPPLTLASLEAAFTALALARGPSAKLQLLLSLLAQATALEVRYIIKLATGDMRTGVKQSLVEEAIATCYVAEPAAVRHAVMLNGNLAEVVTMAATGTLSQARMRLFHPLGFMLASPVATVEEALARFAEEIALETAAAPDLEATPKADSKADPDAIATAPEDTQAATAAAPAAASASPALRAAQLEDKYDGMRAQLHCGDPTQPSRVGLFSRNREDLSASFPELIEAFAAFPAEVILDGEILAWRPAEKDAEPGRALPFSSLQQRLGRKRVTAEMRASTPVVFMAFDLLYQTGTQANIQAGELLLDRALHERRARLEALVTTHAARTSGAPATQHAQATLFTAPQPSPGFPRLLLAPAVQLADAAQLDAAYTEARARGNEGVMLKAAASAYQPGRRGLAWLKLKRELATLDVVITGAEFGNGRRAGVLSDYTFAVRGPGDALLNVGKAYSGLTDIEVDTLSRRLMQQTLEEYGHFRTVEPTILLEVAFNNITRSDRHASGFALRFPRILRIRDDKPLAEIDTLERVETIYASQPDKPLDSQPPTPSPQL